MESTVSSSEPFSVTGERFGDFFTLNVSLALQAWVEGEEFPQDPGVVGVAVLEPLEGPEWGSEGLTSLALWILGFQRLLQSRSSFH